MITTYKLCRSELDRLILNGIENNSVQVGGELKFYIDGKLIESNRNLEVEIIYKDRPIDVISNSGAKK